MKKIAVVGTCLWMVALVMCARLPAGERAATKHSWMGTDVGRVGPAGSHSQQDGTFTLHGAGGGVYIAGDSFYYVYLPLEGDGELTVRWV